MIKQLTLYVCDQCDKLLEVDNSCFGGISPHATWVKIQLRKNSAATQDDNLIFCSKLCGSRYLLGEEK